MATDNSAGQIDLNLVLNQGSFLRQLSSLTGVAKKAGAVLAAALSVKTLVSFGAQCIELGSDLAEVQNVVDVTFPQMSKQIDVFAKNAITQFGLSETMAKRYAGTFGAMAKAFGFSEKSAYTMSTALTGLAGDVASFYNISQDEAYIKLKSVFTGETESLKDLGVVMTQAALDNYALANGFGKTTAKMSEAEKVALRYKFVQEQLTLAAGDFSRTSDGWANQVRVLQLQFDSLKATIGQGLINALTPVIKVINTIIGKLMTLAAYFKAFTEVMFGKQDNTETSMKATANAAETAAAGMGKMADAAGKTKKTLGATGIDELNIIKSGSGSKDVGEASGGVPDIGGMGVYDTEIPVPDIDTSKVEKAAERIKEVFKGLKDFLTENRDAILAIIGGLVAGIMTYFAVSNWGTIVKEFIKIFGVVKTEILGALSGISLPALGIAAVVAIIVAAIIDLWNTSETFRDNMKQAWDLICAAVKSAWSMIWNEGLKPLGAALADLGKTLYNFYEASGLKKLFEIVVTTVAWIASLLGSVLITAIAAVFTAVLQVVTGIIKAITWIVDKLAWVAENWTEIWTSIGDFFSNIWTKLKEIASNFMNAISDTIQNMLSEIQTRWSETWKKIGDFLKQTWERIKETVTQFLEAVTIFLIAALMKIYNEWNEAWTKIKLFAFTLWTSIKEKAVEIFTALKDKLSGIWSHVKQTVEIIWTMIKAFLHTLWSALKEKAAEIFTALKDKLSEIWNSIKQTAESVWNTIKNFVINLWNSIKEKASEIFTAIKNKLAEIWESIKQTVEEKWNAIKTWIQDIWNGIYEKAREVFQGLRDTLSGLWDEVKETIEEKWNAIREWFAEIWQKIKDIFNPEEMLDVGKSFMNKLFDGMKAVWEDITGWLSGIGEAIGNAFDNIVSGVKNMFKKGKEEAEEELEASGSSKSSKKSSSGSSPKWTSYSSPATGPGKALGFATGGFPEDGWFRASHGEILGKFDNGKSVVANNMQITEGISKAVQSGMRGSMAPVIASMQAMTRQATPNLTMVGGSFGEDGSQIKKLEEMATQAMELASNHNLNESYLITMIDLLKRIIDLVEAMDLTVNIDVREIKKKLVELDKRAGYTLRTT
ncbi:MAG: hypothetical protein Q4E24_14045 [bacterium]|nr:hypothetical protein [bacterium]